MEVKWIKITTDMFEDEKIDYIQSLPEGDSMLIIWIRLLTMAGKCNANGYIFLTENIPYTDEMLAYKFKKPLNVIRMALELFMKLGMINLDNSGLYIAKWSKYQNLDGMDKIKQRENDKLRKQKERERKKQIQAPLDEISLPSDMSRDSHCDNHRDVTRDPSYIEEDIEEERDIDIEEDIEEDEDKEKIDSSTAAKIEFSKVVNAFNQNIHMITPMEAEQLQSWLQDCEADVIVKAIEEAVTYNKRSYGYIKAVLNNWLKNNIKTIEDVEAYMRDRQDKKGKTRDEPERGKKNSFSNYGGQRTYDVKELEKQIVYRGDGYEEESG